MKTDNNKKDVELMDYSFVKGFKKQPHKLKVILTDFKGIPKIDIREYYLDDSDGEYKHSQRGIQLDRHKAESLRTVLEKNSEFIDAHLLSKNIEQWLKSVKKIESSSDILSNYEFFKVISKGDSDEVIYNKNHSFGRKIININSKKNKSSDENQLIELITTLLLSFYMTLSQFDRDTKGEFGDFIDDINIKWNNLLKRILN